MRTAMLPPRPRRFTFRLLAVLASAALWVAAPVWAIDPPNKSAKLPDLFDQGGNAGPLASDRAEVSAALKPRVVRDGDVVTLSIQLDLPEGHYTYPQKSTAGKPTTIRLKPPTGLKPLEKDFAAATPTRTKVDPETKEKYEIFDTSVTWTRKFQVVDAAKLEKVAIEGSVRFQLCTNAICKPPRSESFKATARVTAAASSNSQPGAVAANSETAAVAKPAKAPVIIPAGKVHPFLHEVTPTHLGKPHPLRLSFELKPNDARPGEDVTVSITAKLDKGWHAFDLTHPNDGGLGLPVTIRIAAAHGLVPAGKGWRANKAPKQKRDESSKKPRTMLEHYGTVTFSRKFRVAKDANPGAIGISGKFKYQLCDAGNCLFPKTVPFSLGDLTTSVPPPKGSDDVDETPFPGGAPPGVPGGLGWKLLFAFLGGIILNVMPCVLPVIAIKVMSFVNQSGESRSRILALNVVYSLGVISVFLILATLAVVLKIGLGELFQEAEFNVLMACVTFAMGLCLLGVFEIPIPGISTGGAHSEGLPAAYLTGIFATILATPCIGPFVGPILFWSIRQPVFVNYLFWGVIGLGMAFPYLVFGVFPKAVKLLPRPGNWMVRFKQFAGFALMGTVVWFAFVIINKPEYVVALLVMLLGIAVGLWMIGNLYSPTANARHKWIVRGTAAVLAVGICGFGYSMTIKSEYQLPWKPFSEQALNDSLAENKTVMVDFTADWCLTCKTNEKVALNRKMTYEFIRENEVVPLLADYTNRSPEIKQWLDRFETIGVPLTVIFPANRPDQPIVLRGLYTQATLLEKLKEAVGSTQVSAVGRQSSVVSSP